MNWFSGFVLFAVIWFLTLFVILPLRLTTQGDAGSTVPGTPKGAPVDARIKTRMLITTAVAVVLWAIVVGVIVSGVIGVDDLDILYR